MKKALLIGSLLLSPWASARALVFDFSGVVSLASPGGAYGVTEGTPVNGFFDMDPNQSITRFQIIAGHLTVQNLTDPAAPMSDGGILSQWALPNTRFSTQFDNDLCFLLYTGFYDGNRGDFNAVSYKDGFRAGLPTFTAEFVIAPRQDQDAPLPEPSSLLLALAGLLPLTRKMAKRF
jgi:hypothetical protein